MKERYISLMEKALSAYSNEHILRYFNDVKTHGITEHGFPRLTANIGILIAHGRRSDLLPHFIEMMDVCCDMFLRPDVKAANEFSVREIVCCIKEVEDAKAVDYGKVLCWKKKISKIIPEECYDKIVKSETDRITNWALFGAASEYARFHFGLGENLEFVDRQLSCQFQWFDENGMYRDHHQESIHQPIIYDYASRGLLAMMVHLGYCGKYYKQIDDHLKRAGILTLKMQSSTGEIPFGGRSNQFLHNEAWMMLLFEYEAQRYATEGNNELAMAFKTAVARALDATESWLDKQPIRHIKNRFPTETKYGCEDYAYFDKYMITTASNLYVAYLVCDDSIPTLLRADRDPVALQTSSHFHKLFLKSGGYAMEFDLNADRHYDANGLGRVQRAGAPSAICLSCPCPSEPKYNVDIEMPGALSLCSAVSENGEWLLGAENRYEVLEYNAKESRASACLNCHFSNEKTVKETYAIDENGVTVNVEGEGSIGFALPALAFDGEIHTEIFVDEHSLTVSYDGWICKYTTNGIIMDLHRLAANRNGYYHTYLAVNQSVLIVKIEILKI